MLAWRGDRLSRPGDRFRAFMVGYLLYRLCIEAIRPIPFHYFGLLSGLQLLYVAGLLYYHRDIPRIAKGTAVAAKVRPYLFYDSAVSVCGTCLRRVEGSILIKDGAVFMDKWCPQHGRDACCWPTMPTTTACVARVRQAAGAAPALQHRTPLGMPLRLRAVPEHMQHSCLTLVEVTDHCNLRCPICYADSGPHRPASATSR